MKEDNKKKTFLLTVLLCCEVYVKQLSTKGNENLESFNFTGRSKIYQVLAEVGL